MSGLGAAAIGFPPLLAAFWFTAVHFGITEKLGAYPAAAVVSFALLLWPYWFFGFGLADLCKRRLTRPIERIATAALFILPYLVFSVPRGEFRLDLCLELLLAILGITALLEFVPANWADYCVLLTVALIVEKHVFSSAWSIPGLSGLEKLLFVDVMLYEYLVVRTNIEIGFDFRARVSDFAVGLREFAFYAPVALLLGFALGFLHLHRTPGHPAQIAAGWMFTLFFVALPEEIFFRGILLNRLENSFGKRFGPRAALVVSSALFGLAHFN